MFRRLSSVVSHPFVTAAALAVAATAFPDRVCASSAPVPSLRERAGVLPHLAVSAAPGAKKSMGASSVVVAVSTAAPASPAATTSPDFSKVLGAALLAQTAYADKAELKSWSCASCRELPTVSNIKLLGGASGAEGYVGQLSGNRVAIVFTGTDDKKDVLRDIQHRSSTNFDSCGSDCTVHRGFFSYYSQLKDDMIKYIKESEAAFAKTGGLKGFVIVGHSMGGAMAALAAYDLFGDYKGSPQKMPIELYTFGQPRTGNGKFAQQLVANVDVTRVVNDSDAVPHAPVATSALWSWLRPLRLWWADYEHSSRELWLRPAGANPQYRLCSSTTGEDPACSISLSTVDLRVTPHYINSYITALKAIHPGKPQL